jgi:hypothetical protein
VPGVLQAAQQLVEQHHLAAGDHQAGGHILVSGTRLEAVLLLRVVWGKEAKMNGRQANVAAEKERRLAPVPAGGGQRGGVGKAYCWLPP